MTYPSGAKKRMRKMLPRRVDIVDRPATRRNLLLMKSAGKEGELEQKLDGLLKTAASVEQIESIASQLETSGASADLVGELRKVASDLAEDEKVEDKEPAKPVRRNMVKWVFDQLTSPIEKEDIVPEDKKDEGKTDDKKVEPIALTKDDLMKAVNESLAASKEDLLKLVGDRVGQEIKNAVEPLQSEINEIKEAKGLRKSVDGQETQKEVEQKKPMKKEFGKGMFDDVFSEMRVRHLNDRIASVQHSAESAGEE